MNAHHKKYDEHSFLINNRKTSMNNRNNISDIIDNLYDTYKKSYYIYQSNLSIKSIQTDLINIKSKLQCGAIEFIHPSDDSYHSANLNNQKFFSFFKNISIYFKNDADFNWILVSLFLRPPKNSSNPHLLTPNEFYKLMWNLLLNYSHEDILLPSLDSILYSENHIMKEIMFFSWSIYPNDMMELAEEFSSIKNIYINYVELIDFFQRRNYLSDDVFSSLNLFDTNFHNLLSKTESIVLLHLLYQTIQAKKYFKEQRGLFVLETRFNPSEFKTDPIFNKTLKLSFKSQSKSLLKQLPKEAQDELMDFISQL